MQQDRLFQARVEARLLFSPRLLGRPTFERTFIFAMLLAKPAVVADFGANRGEFFAAVRAEYPVSRALLIEADPAFAESLKATFAKEADVLHAALVGGNNKGPIIFTRSKNPESSSIFSERVAVYHIANQVKVPTVDF